MFSWLKKLRERKAAARAEKKEKAKNPDAPYEYRDHTRDVAWNGTTMRDARRSHPGGGPI